MSELEKTIDLLEDMDDDQLQAIQTIARILKFRKPAEKKNVDLSQYMGRGKKLFLTDAGEYIKDLRNNDRV